MDLLLIRHGESTHNVPGVDPTLEPDPPLTDRGRRQTAAAALALRREGFRPAAIHCGPQLRALETASALRAALACPVHVDPDLCECGGLGAVSGRGRSELESAWPGYHFADSVREEGWWRGGEADTDVQRFHERAAVALARLTERHGPNRDRVVVVTHGRFGSALLAQLLGDAPHAFNRYCLDNTGMALVERRPRADIAFRATDSTEIAVRLRWCNRLDHLSRELRT
ncbi:MAG: histidine phosphatase family protein [Armatimonadota bacterium]